MAPGDAEEFPLPIDPLQPWVLAAVHLGHEPGLQSHAAGRRGCPGGRLVHGKGVCGQRGGLSEDLQIDAPCSGRIGAGGYPGDQARDSMAFSSSQHWGLECLWSAQMLTANSLFQPSAFLSQSHSVPCVWGWGKKGGLTDRVDAMCAPPRRALLEGAATPQLL